MIKWVKKVNWLKAFNYLAYSLVFFLIEHVITFKFLFKLNMQNYWMVTPIVLFVVFTFIGKSIGRKDLSTKFLSIISLISLILMFLNKKITNVWLNQNFEFIAFIIIAFFFINLIVERNIKHKVNLTPQNGGTNNLFNLFYINTSKVHEIVMLIDNKIMKTVEREQVSEELLKYNTSLNLGIPDKWSAETGYTKEDSTKKRVYENFDVKTTKSIMLRKIYDTTQKNKEKREKLNLGDLTIFENIELEQRNVDDTVMILNVLQDSKIKNDTNENLEVNLNKMMDKMLDDFTIDYIFTCDKQGKSDKYIIQLPYKSSENFENGYRHNDLQLGKLSLIGIYRGNIDFSKKDSTSSKFLELMSDSYHNELSKKNVPVMKPSNSVKKKSSLQFEFSHKKLDEELHLIDVIAIIQELNIDGKE